MLEFTEVKTHEIEGDIQNFLVSQKLETYTLELRVHTRDNTGYTGRIEIYDITAALYIIKDKGKNIGNVDKFFDLEVRVLNDHEIIKILIGKEVMTFGTNEMVIIYFWTKDNSCYKGFVSLKDLLLAIDI